MKLLLKRPSFQSTFYPQYLTEKLQSKHIQVLNPFPIMILLRGGNIQTSQWILTKKYLCETIPHCKQTFFPPFIQIYHFSSGSHIVTLRINCLCSNKNNKTLQQTLSNLNMLKAKANVLTEKQLEREMPPYKKLTCLFKSLALSAYMRDSDVKRLDIWLTSVIHKIRK